MKKKLNLIVAMSALCFGITTFAGSQIILTVSPNSSSDFQGKTNGKFQACITADIKGKVDASKCSQAGGSATLKTRDGVPVSVFFSVKERLSGERDVARYVETGGFDQSCMAVGKFSNHKNRVYMSSFTTRHEKNTTTVINATFSIKDGKPYISDCSIKQH